MRSMSTNDAMCPIYLDGTFIVHEMKQDTDHKEKDEKQRHLKGDMDNQ